MRSLQEEIFTTLTIPERHMCLARWRVDNEFIPQVKLWMLQGFLG